MLAQRGTQDHEGVYPVAKNKLTGLRGEQVLFGGARLGKRARPARPGWVGEITRSWDLAPYLIMNDEKLSRQRGKAVKERDL